MTSGQTPNPENTLPDPEWCWKIFICAFKEYSVNNMPIYSLYSLTERTGQKVDIVII